MLLTPRLLWAVCLFVNVLGCFVSLSFSSKTSSFLSICFCTFIEVCDAAYCYSASHRLVCVFVHFPLCVRPISTDDTRIIWSVCLFVCVLGWFACLSFSSKNQLISIRLFLYMYRVCDAAYCYSVPHTVVCLSDFRHTYQYRSRRLLLHILHMLGEASYFPYV